MASDSNLGFGLACSYCTVSLPDAQGNMVPVTTIQPSFGIGRNPTTNALVPSTASGRTLLAQDLIRRFSTERGTLPDTNIPTIVGNYGVDLSDYIFADMTPADVGALSAAVDAQARQDERVVQSKASAVLAGDILLVPVNVVDGSGPFKLVFSLNTTNGDFSVLSSP